MAAAQQKYGCDASARMAEQFFADIAWHCTEASIKILVTAGGETSGAVVEGLSLSRLQIDPQTDPGVLALRASDTLVLTLKSSNFGTEDYFEKAARVLSTS